MIDISFEINGRKVQPDRVGDELERAMVQQIEKQLRETLRHVRDPLSGEGARVCVNVVTYPLVEPVFGLSLPY